MPIKRIYVLAALGLLLLATGCATRRPTTHDTTTASTVQPQYYTANFTCSAMGYNANGQLRMQPDSVIWVSASKIIELGRARFTTDSAIVYAKVMGRCFRGTYADLQRRFGVITSFNQLSALLMAPDAEEQLTRLALSFGVEATLQLEPWKRVESLTFPIPIPPYVNPL